jgi:hypothetical protein
MGVKTCHFTRWDVAVSSLKKVVQDYGGTASLNYLDRRVRFGLVLFSGSATLSAPIFRNPNDINTILDNRTATGGTRYDLAFGTARDHLQDILPQDPIKRRTTAILFLTDGEPNEGCEVSPPIVNQIYNMLDPDGKSREIKSYIVGFGSGLGVSAQACLNRLAEVGRTNTPKCNTGVCLSYYAADTAASLANAFQDIINYATEEICDGLDNDCDGQIDNRADGACSCVKSYTRPISSSPHGASDNYQKGVRLYTFLSSYNIQGHCPGEKDRKQEIAQFNNACRNEAIKAVSCNPNKNNQPEPESDAYQFYCQRCCGDGKLSNTCSWPIDHDCQNRPWANNSGTCIEACTNWCKLRKLTASSCNMPQGMLRRSGSGYDANGKLTVLSTLEFGTDVLDKQRRRWLFVHFPDLDYRSKPAQNRPIIAEVIPDNYDFPTLTGTTWQTPTQAGWDGRNHQFAQANTQLLPEHLGIDTQYCDTDDCQRDRDETIWLILGYHETTGASYRKYRLGAIYHSTPMLASAPRENIPDPEYKNWLNQVVPAGAFIQKTVKERPEILYVGTNDGIMHAFHAETGLELWGYIPKTTLQKTRSITNGKAADGGNVYTVDGSPLVQNVQMYRYIDSMTSQAQANWATVLLFGLRAGGKAYVAIDVTNPYRPRLLWEINNTSLKDPNNSSKGTFDRLAYTYAQPYIANVLIDWDGKLQERAVVILPGGVGLDKTASGYSINRTDPAQGGVIYIVDLESGQFLREIIPNDPLSGINAGKERGIAAGAIGYMPLPGITTRVFVGDIMGRIFYIDLKDTNPTKWTIRLFYNLFAPKERTMPIMTAPTVALNQRGELLLFGGTGDLQNIDHIDGVNKLFSLREKLTIDGEGLITKVEAIPNFVAPLNKLLSNEHRTNPGPEVSVKSTTGERLTGTPVIYNSTAYFNTYIPSSDLPICGVSGYSRIYGIHFNDACRTTNCHNALTSNTSSHYYHQVLAYIDPNLNPLKCCEADNTCKAGSENPPLDVTYQLYPTTCGDLHYTVPMLQDSSTAQPYQYYRYLSLGPNTLSMGANLIFQPGEATIVTITEYETQKSHQIIQKNPGTFVLSFQISGRNLASDTNFALDRMRIIRPSDDQKLLIGNFVALGIGNQFVPVAISSWGALFL